MDESGFKVSELEAKLRVQERIIADLTAIRVSGENDGLLRHARNERDRLAQCLNMLAGPLTRKPERGRYFVR